MQFTAETIAAAVGGVVEGDPKASVSTFAKIEEAQPGSITFLSNPKYTHYIYSTGASVVLVKKDFKAEHPVRATLIRVDDPYSCLAALLGMVAKVIKPAHSGIEEPCHIGKDVEMGTGCYVGAYAYIADGCRIGNNVSIFPGAYIGEGVHIGDNSIVYANASVYYGCRIGKRCIIHSGAVIGADGFGFAPGPDGAYHKIEQIGIVVLEDDVEIGANTTVDRSTMGCTILHRGVKIDNLCQLAHNLEVGEDTAMAAQVGVAGSTRIGRHCMFGGQVGIAGHIEVGDNVELGAQSGVPNSVAAGSRCLGSPAVPAGQFARSVAYTKRLADLFARVDALEKQLKESK